MDLFAIRKLNRCVDCNKKWQARPENDPENNRYEFTYKNYATIYAKCEEDAVEQFRSSYEYEDFDFESFKRKNEDSNEWERS